MNDIVWFIITICYFAIIIWMLKTPKRISRKLIPLDGNDQEDLTLPNEDDINYYREIPCNKSLNIAYFLILRYNIISKEEASKNIIGAYLLKWINENRIKVIKVNDTEYNLDFSNATLKIENYAERNLFANFYAASGKNKILESSEFRKIPFGPWPNLSKIENSGYEELVKLGYIIEEKDKDIYHNGKVNKYIKKDIKQEAINLLGLKKLLLDFSELKSKSNLEIKLWEEYMVFAHILGINSQIEKEFSKLYPKSKIPVSKIYEEFAINIFTEILFNNNY